MRASEAACESAGPPCALRLADVAVVRAPPNLEHAAVADQLDRELLEAARRSGAQLVVVDLGKAPTLGSSALRVLVRHAREGQRRGVRLHLVCVESTIIRTLELTLLDRLLPTSPTLAAAMAHERRAS